jgi:EmrB/QacA subfamily drug resistance transporter
LNAPGFFIRFVAQITGPTLIPRMSVSPGLEARTDLKRIMPWLVAVALFMENLDATIVNTATPTIAASLQVEPLSLKGVLTSYTLALAVFIPVSGWMADRFGTKRVFVLAVALFTAGSLLCGMAVNVPMLVVSRIIQGMGGAMMTPVGRLALVRTFPRSEMITAMNYVIIPALIGPLVGPFLGGLIVHWMPWRVIFFINLPFGLIGLWLARRHMPDYRDEQSKPLDWPGFLLFGFGISLLCYALEILGEHSLPASAVAQLALAGVALLFAYGWHARKSAAPMLAIWLFKVRTFRVAVLGGFATRLGICGMPFLLPLLYQIGLGYAPWQAGLLTMPQAAAAIGMKLMSKSLLAKFGHRKILISNTVMLGALIMVFSQVNPGTSPWVILGLSLAQGFVASIQFTSMNSLVYADVDNADASKASSLSSTAQQLSLSVGVAFGSVVAACFLGNVPTSDHPALIRALHHAFIALGALTILSTLSFTRLRPTDGINISNYRLPATEAEATTTA